MLNKTVYLLQETKEANESLCESIGSTKDYKIVGMSEDTNIAFEDVIRLVPDFLVTELVLPGGDGLELLARITAEELPTKIIVTSALTGEYTVNAALANGASYFLAKPVKSEVLINRMNELISPKAPTRIYDVREPRKITLEEKISRIFINVGIPPHIKGYSFLREGVKMAVEEPSIINNITKLLYPRIGEKYSTTPSKVERAIRHAIEVAWNRGRIETINNLLGVHAYAGSEKPTNGEFIALVADKMILEKS